MVRLTNGKTQKNPKENDDVDDDEEERNAAASKLMVLLTNQTEPFFSSILSSWVLEALFWIYTGTVQTAMSFNADSLRVEGFSFPFFRSPKQLKGLLYI